MIPLRLGLLLLASGAAATGCLPGDAGRTIAVENRCASTVAFLLDGGGPPAAPDDQLVERLGPGRTARYSVIVGHRQATYLWLVEPAEEPVVIPAPSDGGEATVVLHREPCVASIPVIRRT